MLGNKYFGLIVVIVFSICFSASAFAGGGTFLNDFCELTNLCNTGPTGMVVAGESCSPAGLFSCAIDGNTQLYCYTCSATDVNHVYCKNLTAGSMVWQFSQYCSTSNRKCENGQCNAICGDSICGTYETAADCPGYTDCPALLCSEGQISYRCKCGGVEYTSGYCCSGVYQSTSCSGGATTCANGAIPGNGACMCNGVTYNTGYCCNGVYSSSTPCSTTAPQCTEGAVPSSGCICAGYAYISGYCCYSYLGGSKNLVWAGNTPCTQTCASIGGQCCAGSISNCVGTWSGQWATDCQGYTCCVGTCTGTCYGNNCPKKSNGESCSSASECSSGYCVHNICRSTNYYCGDAYCDSVESSTTCPQDCGGTNATTRYCGDGICNNGETCSTCPQDCKCNWCGDLCALSYSGMICPTLIPPAGYNCNCQNEVCVGVKTPVSTSYCGDGICSNGENIATCQADCGVQANIQCPSISTCPGGRQVPCRVSGTQCYCEPCSIPKDCEVKINRFGDSMVACRTSEKVCPDIPPGEEERCEKEGGKPIKKRDVNDCDFISCEFGEKGEKTILTKYGECPTKEEMEKFSKKCEKVGNKPVLKYDKGCRYVVCLPEEDVCTSVQRMDEISRRECKESEMTVAVDFNEDGKCPFEICTTPDKCLKALPDEIYLECEKAGGEYMVESITNGCIINAMCVMPGNADEIEYEDVSMVPDMTDLLSMALKLETVKIKLQELSEKTGKIADYYKKVGSVEEEKFRRVTDIFDVAMGKVDEIRIKFKEQVEFVTIDDLVDIKYNLKYIIKVLLKDALYLMLSESDDIGEITRGNIKDCGNDEACFDKAFRVCKPAVFKPDENTKAEIVKVENNKCKMIIMMRGNEMTCFIPDYSLGIRDPEKDVFPYCEGDLKDVVSGDKDADEWEMKYGTDDPCPNDIYNTCREVEEIKAVGPVTLIDFEKLPDGTALQNSQRLTGKEWESLGVVFEYPSEEYLQAFGPMHPFYPIDELSLSPGLGPFEAGGDTHDDLNIIFSSPVKAVGLYLMDLGPDISETESISFLDSDGKVLEKISPWPRPSFGNPAPGTFVYLIHDGISKIEILEDNKDGDDIAYDNLYFVK